MVNLPTIEFTFDEKIKIWLHYVAICTALIHRPLWIKLTKFNTLGLNTIEARQKRGEKVYPILGVASYESGFSRSVIRSFDSFCEVTDPRVSEGLPGHYWRFKNEIFKD